MNKVILEESLNTLNEQELKEADFRNVRNKVDEFLENYYERKVFEFLTEEQATVQEVMQAVPEYNPDWCPEDYTDEVARIEQTCGESMINALVSAGLRTLFLDA
jgi:hypothetical protein